MTQKPLYERLGGYDGITTFVNNLLPRLKADPLLGRFWQNRGDDGIEREKQLLIDYLTKNNVPFDFQSIHYDKVNCYQEMYLMNSVYGVIPVKKYDDICFNINSEITSELNTRLNFDYAQK
jgi:hypothetical protein